MSGDKPETDSSEHLRKMSNSILEAGSSIRESMAYAWLGTDAWLSEHKILGTIIKGVFVTVIVSVGSVEILFFRHLLA